jgi:hypothetical protein
VDDPDKLDYIRHHDHDHDDHLVEAVWLRYLIDPCAIMTPSRLDQSPRAMTRIDDWENVAVFGVDSMKYALLVAGSGHHVWTHHANHR